jgi:peptidoglycan/xylan/chitin deacetylase (PgdA/CDA1 family)
MSLIKRYLIINLLFSIFIIFPRTALAVEYTPVRQVIINGGYETDESWFPYGDGFTYSTRFHQEGNRSLELKNDSTAQSSGAYQRVDLNQSVKLPVTLTGFIKGKNIEKAPGSYFGASLYVEIHLQDGSVAYWNSIANTDTFNWYQAGINLTSLPSVNQPIDHIFVVPILASASGTAWFDNLTLTEYQSNASAVTFMFDDGEDSTLVAKSILDEHNFKASVPIPLENIGQGGYLTKQQIKNLYQGGWEIMSHGISHEDLSQMNIVSLRNELRRPVNFFNRLLGDGAIKNIAYPFGAYSGIVNREAARFYRSGRAYEIGTNQAGSWPFDIKVRSLINTTTTDEVNAWLNEAGDSKGWVVMVGHKVVPAGDDQYYITEQQLRDIAQTVADSGLPVVTYNQGLDLFGI